MAPEPSAASGETLPGGPQGIAMPMGAVAGFAGSVPESATTFIRQDRKVGRNEPCPCDSGKKFKHCHGVLSGGERAI